MASSSYGRQPSAPPPEPPRYGSMFDPSPEDYQDLEATSKRLAFSEDSIRRGFIRKVFSILTVQLLVVSAFIAMVVFWDEARLYVLTHSWIYWLSYVVFFITYISLLCCEGPRRMFPTNVVLLGVLTVSISFMTAMISAMHSTHVVLWAMAICALCSFTIIIFSSQTKFDFTGWISVAYVAGMCLVLFGLLAMIVTLFLGETILTVVYAVLAAVLFMVYMAIDVQLIIGGKMVALDPEEYITAVIFLFLDIVYLFWMLLTIVGTFSDR